MSQQHRQQSHFRGKSNFPPPPRGAAGSSIPAYIWAPAFVVTGGVIMGYYACLDQVPLTNRKRFLATSADLERNLGDQQYRALLEKYKGQVLPETHRASQTVHRVGSRIAAVTKDFCKEHNLHHMTTANNKPFTFTVVRSDQANAFVLPGNHIFVLTGIFRYIRDEDDLAAVLGHEMAHNVARHVGERLSGGIIIQGIASLLLLVDPSGFLSAIFTPAATLMHDLPHSRENESEADRIGLELSARACFDPKAAKRVFSAMKAGTTVSGEYIPPEFISTHPSHDRRISQLDEWIPSAIKVFEGDDFGNRCHQVRKNMAQARAVAAAEASARERQARF